MKKLLLIISVLLGSIVMFVQPRSEEQTVDYYKIPMSSYDMSSNAIKASSAKSHYDYSLVAEQITSGCKSDYQKIRAIYQWICNNIEYDTSYSIYTADECFDAKKGVCQAYCDLFDQIAKACGVNVEIISGKSKDYEGKIGRHAWIFAYTRENHGILLDPTWGAGSVNGRTFTKSNNPWLWFNVNPEWMILSHFPDNENNQLTDVLVTLNEFKSFMPVTELWLEYGLDAKTIARKVRNGGFTIPKFYSCEDEGLELVDFPMCKSLDVGEFYTFRIKMGEREFAIINNSTFTKRDEWENEGNGIYSIKYMVKDISTLRLSVRNNSNNMWDVCVEYPINQPTQSNWKKVEKFYPLSIPEVKNTGNLYAGNWEQAGIDNRKLLQLIRNSGTKELPILFTDYCQKLKIESVPMTKTLKKNNMYAFSFLPKGGINWAVINAGTWYKNWNISEDGTHSMTVIPAETGFVRLSVQFENGGSYYSCLEYEVID